MEEDAIETQGADLEPEQNQEKQEESA